MKLGEAIYKASRKTLTVAVDPDDRGAAPPMTISSTPISRTSMTTTSARNHR
jgi:hypothetical protein